MGEALRQDVTVVELRARQLDALERSAGLAGQRIGRLRVTVVRHAGGYPLIDSGKRSRWSPPPVRERALQQVHSSPAPRGRGSGKQGVGPAGATTAGRNERAFAVGHRPCGWSGHAHALGPSEAAAHALRPSPAPLRPRRPGRVRRRPGGRGRGYAADLVTKKLQENPGPVPLEFVEQRVQAGTGDAVAVGLTGIPEDDLDALDHDDGDVLVLPGDTPLIQSATLAALVLEHRLSGAACTLLTARMDDPDGYGRIVRDGTGASAGSSSTARPTRPSWRSTRSTPASTCSGAGCWPRRCGASRPTTPSPSCTSPT